MEHGARELRQPQVRTQLHPTELLTQIGIDGVLSLSLVFQTSSRIDFLVQVAARRGACRFNSTRFEARKYLLCQTGLLEYSHVNCFSILLIAYIIIYIYLFQ